jgi:uncharacterized membrane protein (DUF373 family)
MSIKTSFQKIVDEFRSLSLYQRYEHFIILILIALIAVVVGAAMWKLVLKILFGLVLTGGLDPSNYGAFQIVFGMIFTVIIALEFKKSLLVVAQRQDTVVQMRSVIIIAILAICRKIIILDIGDAADAQHLFALAAAILALGIVYWLVTASDARKVAPAK